MNSVSIIGTMTRDLTLKYLPSGVGIGEFAIAVNQDYKNKEGQKVEKVSFFDITVIGKQAETINRFFHKGSRIGINGELEQQTWKAQDGTNRSKVIIKLRSFAFIDKKSDSQGQSTSEDYNNNQQRPQPQVQYENGQGKQVNQQQYNQQQRMPQIDIDEDEVPF